MFIKFKNWFIETKNDFKAFGIRQMDVLVGFAVLWIGSYVAGHFVVLYSEPYALTENFIKSNPAVIELVGEIKSVALVPMEYSIKWQGSGGFAEMELGVAGSKSHFQARAYLERADSKWTLLKVHALFPNHDVLPLKQ